MPLQIITDTNQTAREDKDNIPSCTPLDTIEGTSGQQDIHDDVFGSWMIVQRNSRRTSLKAKLVETKGKRSGHPNIIRLDSNLQKRPNISRSCFAIFGMEEDCVVKEKVMDEQMEHVEEVVVVSLVNLQCVEERREYYVSKQDK